MEVTGLGWLTGTLPCVLRAVIPTASSGAPPLPRHDCTTLGAYPASSCFTSSATTQWVLLPSFPTEEREAQKGRTTCSGSHKQEGAELESAPSSESSAIEIGCSSSHPLGAAVSLTLWPKCPVPSRCRPGEFQALV